MERPLSSADTKTVLPQRQQRRLASSDAGADTDAEAAADAQAWSQWHHKIKQHHVNLGALFDKMDEDGDGSINKKDLTDFMLRGVEIIRAHDHKQLKKKYERQMAPMFERLDKDHDGFITKGAERDDPAFTDNRKEFGEEKFNRLFNYADMNGDGKLDLPEFTVHHFPELKGKEQYHRFRAKEDIIAAGGGGKISADQWEQHHRAKWHRGSAAYHSPSDKPGEDPKLLTQMLDHERTHFWRADEDGNKELDEKELAKLHTNQHDENVVLAANYLWELVDNDGSGKMDKEEATRATKLPDFSTVYLAAHLHDEM